MPAALGARLGIWGDVDPQLDAGDGRLFGMIVPAYYEETSALDWDVLLSTGSDVVPYAIFAPHSGPGIEFEQPWADIRQRMSSHGVTALAYVDARNATRPLTEVSAEVDRYAVWYHPNGLFLDNAGQSPANIGYLQHLRDHMQSDLGPGAVLVLNAGIYPDESYMSVADVVNLETSYEAWLRRGPVPAWARQYPSTRFSLIVTATPVGQMPAILESAAISNIGYVFLEDSRPEYRHVPSYLNEEAGQLRTRFAPSPRGDSNGQSSSL